MEQDKSNAHSNSTDSLNNSNKENHSKNRIQFNNTHFDTIYIPISIHERNVTAKQLRYSLKKCLEHIVIKIHDEIFERMTGILQGSICSRNLCDLYLGRIERKLFCYDNSSAGNLNTNELPFKLNRTNEIILRNVDDYLIISTEYERLIKIKDLIKMELTFNDKKTVIYKWTPLQRNKLLSENESIYELDKSDMEIGITEATQDSYYLENHSGTFFHWCGFNIDVNSLDIYLNYDKYFDDPTSLKNRINCSNSIQVPFIQFNLKFLRLFTVNISNLLIDLRVNSVQAILRNFVDLFALSVIRFFLLYNTMPKQLTKNPKLQLKLMLNLCYWLNNRISFHLTQHLLQHFYTCLSLLKFLCLKTYSYLIRILKINNKSALKKHSDILKLVNKSMEKLSFQRCIKHKSEHYFAQINKLIEEQLEKFTKCII